MKIKLFYLLFLIVISCGSSNHVKSKPIFRYVDLDTYGKFELGENIQKINSLTEIKNDHLFLKENVFGGAESIEIISNSNGNIAEIIFYYGDKTSLKTEIEEYQKTLGIPEISNNKATWNDGKTSFELYEIENEVYSKMTDLIK
ncbi:MULTISPECIES: hypothetical protein [Chryseobacterium]|uniref:hypothetical protein n=1 Tax=Chryseobacterium sp. R2A-55 TaxID=2744445 RepID=UPI001F2B6345|nr:hypothetical protein [Chryseobacterium sp. R2A-55]